MRRKYRCVLALIMAIILFTTSTSTVSAVSGPELRTSTVSGVAEALLSLISTDEVLVSNISYAYSKAITRDEPALSVQVNSPDTDKCEWYYTYSTDTAETYHQQTNYMFEISNSRNGMFVGDFRLKLDYKFIVDKGICMRNRSMKEASISL